MRWSAALGLAGVVYTSLAFGQTAPVDPIEASPVDPIEASPVQPAPAPAPSPAPAAPVVAPAPRPAPAAAAPTEPASDVGHDTRAITSLGIGATFVAFGPVASGESVGRPGLLLHAKTHIPFAESAGLGLRFAWGLTEFRRFEDFARTGYRIGSWTTEAYKDVWEWAGTDDDARFFRWMGGLFAFVGLLFPYAVAGMTYVVGAFSPTTYLEFDVTANYLPLGGRTGPYLEGGLGFLAMLHPRTDTLLGGAGPTAAVGLRADKLDVGLRLTYLPPYLHGEAPGERTHVYVAGATLGGSF